MNKMSAFLVIYCFVSILSDCYTQEVTFSDQIIIDDSIEFPVCVFCTDIDNDGDYDVLSGSSSDGYIVWYENINGTGNFGPPQIITEDIGDSLSSLYSVDLDGDGDNDVLSATYWGGIIAWYENSDGLGSFSPQQEIEDFNSNCHQVYSTDYDGDGDNDVLASFSHWLFGESVIRLYYNDGNGNFIDGWPGTLMEGEYNSSLIFSCALLDLSVWMDVFFAVRSGEHLVGWNDGWNTHVITNNLDLPWSVFCSDLDGDGDVDGLSASTWDDIIAWYENTNGNGDFQQNVITNTANGARCVYSSDIDNDGDNDVLSASAYDDKIAWYENTDGLGDFGPEIVITEQAVFHYSPWSIVSVDLDGDGDFDVCSAEWSNVAWYENLLELDSLLLQVTPLNPPIQLSAFGGSFEWNASVENISPEPFTFDAWTEIILPNGTYYGPLVLYTDVNLDAGVQLNPILTVDVPWWAPSGTYSFIAKVGSYPDDYIDSDSFTFEKLDAAGPLVQGVDSPTEWSSSGWFEDEYDLMDLLEPSETVPTEFTLSDAYPNPFNPSTTITIEFTRNISS